MNNDALEVRAMETKLGNAPGKIEGLRDIEPDADVIVGSYSSNVVNTMMLGLKHRTNDRHPAEGWMKQIARNMTLYGGDCLRAAGTCCMTGQYTHSFRAIIEAGLVKALPLPARSPNLNAHAQSCVRWRRRILPITFAVLRSGPNARWMILRSGRVRFTFPLRLSSEQDFPERTHLLSGKGRRGQQGSSRHRRAGRHRKPSYLVSR